MEDNILPKAFSQNELAAMESRASDQYNIVQNPVWKSAYLRLIEASMALQNLQKTGKYDRAGCETQ